MLKGNELAVYTHDYVKQVLTAAKDGKYVLPAINVSNLDTAIAAMNGLEQAGSPGFVQVSIGAAEQASPDGDPVKGSLILGRMIHELRKQYSVPIFIHTDHCHARNVDKWLKPLLMELIRLQETTGERIFDSFMFDGSMVDIHENARVINELVPLIKQIDGFIEVEAGGAWGGSEDGVEDKAKYSTPDDVRVIQQAMHDNGLNADDYLLAVAFGNAHGTAVVPDLKPGLLSEISVNTGESNLFVFHGGSGSPDNDVRAAVRNGVVKMNVDTDTQYAFTAGVTKFFHDAPNVESVPSISDIDDDETDIQRVIERIADNDEIIIALVKQYAINANYGAIIDLLNVVRSVDHSETIKAYDSHKEGKKYFDPRHWNHAGRESMSKHVIQVAELLGSKDMA